MDHRLILELEKALDWSGPHRLGEAFARGSFTDATLASRLLTPTKLLDLLMRRSLTEARVRCLQNGRDVHPQAFISSQAVRRAGSLPMVDMERLGLLLKEGCTLVCDGVDVYDPTLEIACRALQWWTRELVRVNLYLTTGEAAGFDLHWDDHDVLVVQLAGEKSWEVRGLSRVAPMYRDAAPNLTPPEDVLWTGTMQAGDVMHIPRGYWHTATREHRGDGYSLHATFGFTKQTGVHWLSWLADEARSHERFRFDLDRRGYGDEQRAKHVELVEEAIRLVATRSPAAFLLEREQQHPAARHVATHGVFGVPTSVVCVTDFRPDIQLGDEMMVVRAGGKEIQLQPTALPAVALLLSGQPVDVAEVAGTTGVDAAELAGMFVDEGICGEVTEALATGYRQWLS